jgi:transposase
MTVGSFDGPSGEVQQAQIFVAVMAASGYTCAEATATQQLPDWIGDHCWALASFNGVSQLRVPDNTKTGITKACFYEPDINPSYLLDTAHHYGTAILPTRARKPRDKAMGEGSVLLVERWILARIRNETFFSLSELNRRLRGLIEDLNGRPFQKLPGSRRSAFEQIDRPALKPLPAQPDQFAEWKKATVNIDYHVELERQYYGVPYRLLRKKLDLRYTATAEDWIRRRSCNWLSAPGLKSITMCSSSVPPVWERPISPARWPTMPVAKDTRALPKPSRFESIGLPSGRRPHMTANGRSRPTTTPSALKMPLAVTKG